MLVLTTDLKLKKAVGVYFLFHVKVLCSCLSDVDIKIVLIVEDDHIWSLNDLNDIYISLSSDFFSFSQYLDVRTIDTLLSAFELIP